MSATTITLPREFPYVVLAGVSSTFLLAWQTIQVGRARKAAGVPYPAAYATAEEAAKNVNAMKFNCVQRAHLNTVESYPVFLFSLIVTGLEYPRFATGAAAVWFIGRVLYTIGYSTGDPKNRNRGGFGNLAAIGLVFSALASSVNMVRRSL